MKRVMVRYRVKPDRVGENEVLVRDVLAFLAARGYEDVLPIVAAEESVLFSLPHELNRDLKAKSGVEATMLRYDMGSLH